MQHIHSKDIFMLIRDTLKLYDRRLMDHGSKVAYYVYKMLQCKGGYEEYQLADIVFLATFHDIGAYKTESMDEILQFETKNFKAHSFYGYFFLKNLTPIGEMAKVILYHHMDCAQLEKIGFVYKDLASYINLAETVDIFSESMGEKFNMDILQKRLGTKVSYEAYELFMEANKKYDMFGAVKSQEYKKELEKLLEFYILPNNEKEKLLEFIMFTLALKSEASITDAVTTLAISQKLGIGMGLTKEQLISLRYAAYVHDIGMLALPKGWLDSQGKISLTVTEKIKQHTLLAEHLLQNRMKKDVIAIVSAHHEHADGSGYPRKLVAKQMNTSQMILQFADAVSVLLNPRPGRPVLEKTKIMEMVRKQTDAGMFSPAVAKAFLEGFDELSAYVENYSKEILADYRKLNAQYTNATTNKG